VCRKTGEVEGQSAGNRFFSAKIHRVKPHRFLQGRCFLVFRNNDAYVMAKLRQMLRNILGIGSAARTLQREMIDQ
jgi:hypothetical protein